MFKILAFSFSGLFKLGKFLTFGKIVISVFQEETPALILLLVEVI